MPTIRFLFRFRDLVAPTIKEHRRIIKERDWCWWGWWKRPSEGSRSDIWDDIANQTGAGKSVEVGLFDSGSGNVYRAVVTGVIKPSQADDPDMVDVLPAKPIRHVPSYYRKSPYSRAWMKITEIDSKPLQFFDKYSFAEVPTLPNYAPATLNRFKNKKIRNADELRLMDTTIWQIRPSLLADSSEQILLSVKAFADAVSSEIVACRSDNILHLTDMHFAVGTNRAQHVWQYDSDHTTRHTLVQAVTTALARAKCKVSLVIVSGDLTFIGDPSEFDEARTAIAHLLGILDLSADHLVIIPGNHDIQWTTKAKYDHNAKVEQAPPEAKRNFEKFYRDLFRYDPNRHLSMGRRFAFPCGLTIEVCGINSSSLETGEHFLAGMGRIDEGAFAEVAQQLGWSDARSLALRLLVIHHHLALVEDLEPAEGYGKGYGLAVDAVRVQRMAAKYGVHLALHGHKHRSFIWRSIIYELPEHAQPDHRLGELSIIGGGSAGSKERDGASNYFNVISIEPSRLKLDIYRSQNEGEFSVMQRWQGQLSLDDPGGLKLSDWVKKGA